MGNWLIQFINNCIKGLADFLKWVVSLLPTSPFNWIANSDMNKYMSGLNWFFPISQIIATLEAWLTAIALYYAYQIVMRWVKAIE